MHNLTSPAQLQAGQIQDVRTFFHLITTGKGHFVRRHYHKLGSKVRKIFLIETKKMLFFYNVFSVL